jgi:hypothetical protein
MLQKASQVFKLRIFRQHLILPSINAIVCTSRYNLNPYKFG